ncbi:hypothetical protein P7B02_04135 [Caulobacter segnis]|uniref:hypothetical protein n=1 Tax=Caulobacter segnis TaxID=88688 RepID=UPI00240EA5CA|nr:hypothetical protein [Caulobacter segnis]MDG2520722.1 hypothetical protein [Caulobacter segnis]
MNPKSADRLEAALHDELYGLVATAYDDNPVAAVIRLRALSEIGEALELEALINLAACLAHLKRATRPD